MCNNQAWNIPSSNCNIGIKVLVLIPNTDIVESKDGAVRLKRKYGKFQRDGIKVFKTK